jgi:hypothetical protein
VAWVAPIGEPGEPGELRQEAAELAVAAAERAQGRGGGIQGGLTAPGDGTGRTLVVVGFFGVVAPGVFVVVVIVFIVVVVVDILVVVVLVDVVVVHVDVEVEVTVRVVGSQDRRDRGEALGVRDLLENGSGGAGFAELQGEWGSG